MSSSGIGRSSIGMHDLLVRVAEAGLRLQRQNGSFPPGCNGPWAETVTPVRNTGHWLITLARAYQLSGDRRFRQAGEKAIGYLLSPAARPDGYTFLHRPPPSEDGCNGLIGQAWSLQALIAGYRLTGDEDLLQTASEVFSLHAFDQQLGLWHMHEVDGRELGLSPTLNQQIWFAAVGRQLGELGVEPAAARARRFRQRLPHYLRLDAEGFFRHMMLTPGFARAQPRRVLGELLNRTWRRSRQRELRVGYHAFCLAGLARLLPEGLGEPSEDLARKVRSALKAAIDKGSAFESNRYAYGYNPVGFEIALALERFPIGDGREPADWAQRQLDLCFDPARSLMVHQSADEATLAARFCEAADLPNYRVAIDS